MSPRDDSRSTVTRGLWKETNYDVVSGENRLTIESGGESVSIPAAEVAAGQRNQITQRALTWCGACEVWPKTGTPFAAWKRGKLFSAVARLYSCACTRYTQLAHPLPSFLPSCLSPPRVCPLQCQSFVSHYDFLKEKRFSTRYSILTLRRFYDFYAIFSDILFSWQIFYGESILSEKESGKGGIEFFRM